MKINNKILEGIIKHVIKENIDSYYDDPLNQSDAEYDAMMDDYMRKYPEEYAEYTGIPLDDVYKQINNKENNTNNGEILPFEACTNKNMKAKLNETQLRNVVKKTISKILKESGYYPMGAEYDSNAPWNDTSNDEEQTVSGTAIYYNEANNDTKEVPFNVTVIVNGNYETDGDEEGDYNYFVADENTDYEQLVRDSGDIPETLDGGYVLDGIDIDDID